jgi:hypothetical protein
VDIILNHNKRLTLGVFYRPPNKDLQPLSELQTILNDITTDEIIILGEFNLADVDWINIKSQKDTPLHNLL